MRGAVPVGAGALPSVASGATECPTEAGSSPPPYRPFIDHSLPERAPLHFHGSSTFPHTRGCHGSPCVRNEPLRIAKLNSLLRAELSKSSQALPDPGQGHAAAFRPLCSQIHNLHLYHPWIFPGTASVCRARELYNTWSWRDKSPGMRHSQHIDSCGRYPVLKGQSAAHRLSLGGISPMLNSSLRSASPGATSALYLCRSDTSHSIVN